ncbi:MAG: hypothetical protein AAGJ81_08235 [Verrucomicrobiota bacterium]
MRQLVADGATRVTGSWNPDTGEFDFTMERGPRRLGYRIEEVSELLGGRDEGYSVQTLRRLATRKPGKAPVLSSTKPGKERLFFLPLLVRDLLARGDFPADLTERAALDIVLDHAEGRLAG